MIIKVNFGNEDSSLPSDEFILDSGKAYSEAEGSGWVQQDSIDSSDPTPIDISANTRDRDAIEEQSTDTLIHLQYPEEFPGIPGTEPPVKTPSAWEYELENGTYEVTVGVGDPEYTDSNHVVNLEGESVISGFEPTEEQLFTEATAVVEVTDGKLTLDAIGGENTKLNFIEIAPQDSEDAEETEDEASETENAIPADDSEEEDTDNGEEDSADSDTEEDADDSETDDSDSDNVTEGVEAEGDSPSDSDTDNVTDATEEDAGTEEDADDSETDDVTEGVEAEGDSPTDSDTDSDTEAEGSDETDAPEDSVDTDDDGEEDSANLDIEEDADDSDETEDSANNADPEEESLSEPVAEEDTSDSTDETNSSDDSDSTEADSEAPANSNDESDETDSPVDSGETDVDDGSNDSDSGSEDMDSTDTDGSEDAADGADTVGNSLTDSEDSGTEDDSSDSADDSGSTGDSEDDNPNNDTNSPENSGDPDEDSEADLESDSNNDTDTDIEDVDPDDGVSDSANSDDTDTDIEVGIPVEGGGVVETVEPVEGGINFNFGVSGAADPSGFERDFGEAYDDDRGYGWVTQDTAGSGDATPIDLVANGRDRDTLFNDGQGGVFEEPVRDSLIHMQYPTGLFRSSESVTTPAAWEYEIANGQYEVTVGVGDSEFFDSNHVINVEGQSLISGFEPQGFEVNGSLPVDGQAFSQGSGIVEVEDGKLTVDAIGGDNTKINYISIVPVDV